MRIEKHGNGFRTEFVINGQRYRPMLYKEDGTLCTTEREAKAAAPRAKIKCEDEAKNAVALKRRPQPADYELAQLFAALKPTWEIRKDWKNKQRAIAELIHYFYEVKNVRRVAQLSENDITDYITWAMAQPIPRWFGGCHRDPDADENARFWGVRYDREGNEKRRDPATMNQTYLTPLRLALKHAGRIRDHEGAFVFRNLPHVQRLKTYDREATPIPDEVFTDILNSDGPLHTKHAAIIALCFGLRESEVFDCRIKQVEFSPVPGIRLDPKRVKEKRGRLQQGSPKAMAFLAELITQARARGVEHLITWKRGPNWPWAPLSTSAGAWKKIMDGIEAKHGRRWRWHDTRAAYITHVATTSGPADAQVMARHVSAQTTARYIGIVDERRRVAAVNATERPCLDAVLKTLDPAPAATPPMESPHANVVALKKRA